MSKLVPVHVNFATSRFRLGEPGDIVDQLSELISHQHVKRCRMQLCKKKCERLLRLFIIRPAAFDKQDEKFRQQSPWRLAVALAIFALATFVAGCEQPTNKIQPVDLAELNEPASPSKRQSSDDASNQTDHGPIGAAEPSQKNPDNEPYAFGKDSLDFDQYTIEGLMDVVRSGDLQKSEALIKHFLAKDPHNVEIHRARQQLASGYARTRKDEAAMKVNRDLLKYFFANADGNRELCELFPTTVIFTNALLQNEKKDDERKKLLTDALNVLRKNQNEFIDAEPLATGINLLSGIQIRDLVGADRRPEAGELAESEISRLKVLADANPKNEMAQVAYAATIKNAFLNLPFETEKNVQRMEDYEEIVVRGVDRDRSSELFARNYFGIVRRRMGLFLQGDPNAAKAYYDQAYERLVDITKKQPDNDTLARSLRSMRSFESRIDKLLKLAELKGSPAPEIEGKHWINGDKFTLAENRGKKCVLLMFTRADSRTCARCLPRIQVMSLKNQNDLNVVGVSQFFGLAWDNSRGQAVRKPDASQEKELEAIENFAKANQIAFPIVVVGEDLIQRYAATSMPHFVLIDRSGNIRHITVGLDPQGLEELEAAVATAVVE